MLGTTDALLATLWSLGAKAMIVKGEPVMYGEPDGSEPNIVCVIDEVIYDVSAIEHNEQESWKVLEVESGRHLCTERSRVIQGLINI